MCLQQAALIGKQPVRHYRVSKIHQVKDVQIHIGGEIPFDEVLQNRHQEQSHRSDSQADDPVDGTVQVQQGTDRLGIVLGDGLVHAEDHGTAHTKLRQVQKSQERLEQAVQAQIFRPQIVQHDRTDDERKKHVDDFHRPVKYNIPGCVPGAFKLHDLFFDPFPI